MRSVNRVHLLFLCHAFLSGCYSSSGMTHDGDQAETAEDHSSDEITLGDYDIGEDVMDDESADPPCELVILAQSQLTYDTEGLDEAESPVLAWTGSELGLAWQDRENGMESSKVLFSRLSLDGERVIEDVLVSELDYPEWPSMAFSGSEYAIVDEGHRNDREDVYFIRVSPGGERIGEDVRLPFVTGSSPYENLSVVFSGSEYAVAYVLEGISETGLRLGRFALDGSPVGDHIEVSDGALRCSLAAAGNDYALAWDVRRNIYFSLVGCALP